MRDQSLIEAVETSNSFRKFRSKVNMSSRKITPKKLKVREQLEAMKNDLEGSKDRRLQEECEKAEYRPPCQGEQVGDSARCRWIDHVLKLHKNGCCRVLSKIHNINYVEFKHVFRFVINQGVLCIILPMSPYYQNTRTRSGMF